MRLALGDPPYGVKFPLSLRLCLSPLTPKLWLGEQLCPVGLSVAILHCVTHCLSRQTDRQTASLIAYRTAWSSSSGPHWSPHTFPSPSSVLTIWLLKAQASLCSAQPCTVEGISPNPCSLHLLWALHCSPLPTVSGAGDAASTT